MRPYKICVITASRSEYGLLYPIIKRIHEDDACELRLIVTGAHLEEEFGLTARDIDSDGFGIIHKVRIFQGSNTLQILETMSNALLRVGSILYEIKPQMVVILGDRYELLPIAGACVALKIPVAHISGGEISEGAYDEYFRHAITKLSYLHFTSTQDYRRRVIQLGESPERVFCVGDLGIENINRLERLSKEQLESELGITLRENLLLVTFHPTTLESNSAEQLVELLKALEEKHEFLIIFTRSNADTGGSELNRLIDDFVLEDRLNRHVFPSLGHKRFLSLAAYSTAVVGNSSSGIVEIPSLGVGTINIGTRQKGRICADSVIHCKADKKEILEALEKVSTREYRDRLKKTINPYESDNTSKIILEEIKRAIKDYSSMRKKFYDL